jgi:DNA-binding sugar fermentation-stimulating protein
MDVPTPLLSGRLIARYKRFLVDLLLAEEKPSPSIVPTRFGSEICLDSNPVSLIRRAPIRLHA